jgi:endo-1,4-beta-xylanase
MHMLGHVLFWHSQTPTWVFHDNEGKRLSKELLLARMRQHVRALSNRYGESIHAWDVVNETILANGKLRDSPWTQILGPNS